MIVDIIWPDGEVIRRHRLEDFFTDNPHLVDGNRHAYIRDLRVYGETVCCGATLRKVHRRRPDCAVPGCPLMVSLNDALWCHHHAQMLRHEIVRGILPSLPLWGRP